MSYLVVFVYCHCIVFVVVFVLFFFVVVFVFVFVVPVVFPASRSSSSELLCLSAFSMITNCGKSITWVSRYLEKQNLLKNIDDKTFVHKCKETDKIVYRVFFNCSSPFSVTNLKKLAQPTRSFITWKKLPEKLLWLAENRFFGTENREEKLKTTLHIS